MVGDLDHLVVIKVSSLSLNVVAFVVLVEESSEVAVGSEFRIVQVLVIVSNSLHIFWSIDDLWVMWRLVVTFLKSVRSVDTLIGIVELEPISAGCSRWVQVFSSDSQIMSKSLGGSVLSQVDSLLTSINLNICISLEKNSVIRPVFLGHDESLRLLHGRVLK